MNKEILIRIKYLFQNITVSTAEFERGFSFISIIPTFRSEIQINNKKHIKPYVHQYLSQTDRKCIAFYRMSKKTYQKLARMVGSFLEKMNTNMRECVPAGERILITLW